MLAKMKGPNQFLYNMYCLFFFIFFLTCIAFKNKIITKDGAVNIKLILVQVYKM